MSKKILLAMVDIAHRKNAIKLCRKAAEQQRDSDELHVAYVMPYGYFSYVEPFVSEESIKAAAKRAHDDLDAVMADSGVSAAIAHVLRGGIGEQALMLAKKLNTSIILINAHRPGVEAHSLGVHASQIVSNATCTVMVLR